MARRRSGNRLLVPGAREGMTALQTEVLQREGYRIDPGHPGTAKYEVAKSIGVPLSPGGNGSLTTEAAGKVGGAIGGLMMRELIRRAKLQFIEGKPQTGGVTNE